MQIYIGTKRDAAFPRQLGG